MESWKKSMLNNLKALLLMVKKTKFTSWRKPYVVWSKLPMPGTLKLIATSLKMVSLEAKVSPPSIWRAKVILKSLLLLFMLMIWFLLEMMRRWLKNSKKKWWKKYEMSDMGLLHYFLVIEVYQEEDEVFICQKRYDEHILKMFGMASCNPVSTPLVVNEKLKDGRKMVDETHFRSLVGNLLYLTTTRLDIMFVASLLSRFMHYPSHLHIGATKRVLRYLQGTVKLEIKYFKNIKMKLIGRCDSDWGGCVDDMKNRLGFAFFLGLGVISWVSKRWGLVAHFSAEVEYISASLATSQAIWLRRILEDIKEKQNEATDLLCDNKSTIAITKNYVFHSRTRHIAVKYHFIKEAISNGEVQLMKGKQRSK